MTRPNGDDPERDESDRQPDPEAEAEADAEVDLDPVDGEEDEYDEDDDDDGDGIVVPRLPRGKGFRFAGGDLIRIAMFATLLVAVVMLREPCSRGVAKFVGSFDVDAGVAPAPTPVPEGRIIRLRGDETEEELRQLLGRDNDAGVPPAPESVEPPTEKPAEE